MSDGASSHYPVGILLNRLIGDAGGTPAEFIRRLGYRNIERGLRRLQPWLDDGQGFERIIKQIIATFPAVEDELRLAIAATKTVKDAEFRAAWLKQCEAERATFVPFIHADGERTVPNGICIFGMTGGHRRWTMIQIPESILVLPLDEQLAALPKLMRSYLLRYEGQCPFFGLVRGFKYVRLLDYYQFDSNAVLIGQVSEPFRESPCYVELR